MTTADAILSTLQSANVPDANLEAANVVDTINSLALATRAVASAITPCVAGGTDETGGHVESLTEAVMGITTGLCRIASSIDNLAEAVREHAVRMEQP